MVKNEGIYIDGVTNTVDTEYDLINVGAVQFIVLSNLTVVNRGVSEAKVTVSVSSVTGTMDDDRMYAYECPINGDGVPVTLLTNLLIKSNLFLVVKSDSSSVNFVVDYKEME